MNGKPEIADHELLRPIGAGGYGQVWLARSLTHTYRAVKIIERSRFSSARPFEREFRGIQQFEPISRSHPGLIHILHVGSVPGGALFYYVMEAADDRRRGPEIDPESYEPKTLAASLEPAPVPVPRCLELGRALSGALAHLHRRGLIHRDIKPANILFVGGEPKLADVGLVTQAGHSASLVGTEGYLPPEGPGSPSADVFSLGLVLYQLNTGKPPEEFPDLPTGLRQDPDGPQRIRLNEIVLRACAPVASQRFPTAVELEEALSELSADLGYAGRLLAPRAARPGGLLLLHLASEPHPATKSLETLLKRQFAVSSQLQAISSVSWARNLEQSVATAPVVVFLLTPASVAHEMTAYAADLARRRCEEYPDTRLIVVRHECSELPRTLKLAFAHATHIESNPGWSSLLDLLKE